MEEFKRQISELLERVGKDINILEVEMIDVKYSKQPVNPGNSTRFDAKKIKFKITALIK